MRWRKSVAVAVMLAGGWGGPGAWAQDANPNPQGQPQGQSNPTPVSPARPNAPLPGQRDLVGALRGAGGNITQMRERVNQTMQRQLEATDEEWKVLGPRIERLICLRVDANGGIGTLAAFVKIPPGLVGILRAAGVLDALGPFADLFDSPVALASEDLRALLADPQSRSADVAFHLDEFRRARDKTRVELEKAQAELKQILTARQESLLLMYGLID